MDNCTEIAALLDPYIDAELSPADARRVREHLASCQRCRSYVQAALAIRDAFPAAEEVEVPEGFADGVMAAVRADRTGRQQRRRVRWAKRLAPLAACCAVVVLAASVLPRLELSSADIDARNAVTETALCEELPEAGEGGSSQAAAAASGSEESAPAAAQEAAPAADTPAVTAAAEDSGPSASVFSRAGEAAGEAADAMSPAESDVVPEAENGAVYKIDAGSWFATLTLTPEQAGSALEDLPAQTPVSYDPATGGTVYALTAEQFDTLLDRLGHPAYTAEGDGDLARVILLPE